MGAPDFDLAPRYEGVGLGDVQPPGFDDANAVSAIQVGKESVGGRSPNWIREDQHFALPGGLSNVSDSLSDAPSRVGTVAEEVARIARGQSFTRLRHGKQGTPTEGKADESQGGPGDDLRGGEGLVKSDGYKDKQGPEVRIGITGECAI